MALTQTLLDEVTAQIQSFLDSNLSYGAVGTSSTTPTAADTTLGAEVVRNARTSSDTSTSNVIVVSLTVGATEANGDTLQESGWLDAASAGNLLIHTSLNPINKTSDVQCFLDTQVTITVTDTS